MLEYTDRSSEPHYAKEIAKYGDLIICCYSKIPLGSKVLIGGTPQKFTVIAEATKEEYLQRDGKFKPIWDFFYKVITD